MEITQIEFEAIGTQWVIKSSSEIGNIKSDILARIKKFDNYYSRFKSNSIVMKMGAKPGTYVLPDDAQTLLDFYQKLYKITDGLVTPLIGSTLEQAGYDADYSFKVQKVSSPPKWEDALDYKFPKLTIKQPVVLDFGAAGKGYLVDIIKNLMIDAEHDNFSINAGGDIFAQGSNLRIGLENPDNIKQSIGVVELSNRALCGSAGNRRRWASFHHTINPITLSSPEDIKAIWVQAESTMLADGLTTALYFVEPIHLRKHFSFEYAMIKGDDIIASNGFKAEIFN